ncbi:MAG: symmetrical bis(5'-nucleosyl)-tetraphosphatase [Myxococcales bacterium]|nr:symmetrical bis(5'-nucleosyl)-tetraphosphatase [Myxococcales bacterium]
MSVYAVGDVQGCDRTLAALLWQIDFDPARDHLVLVGDLVNRGPASLAVLHRVMDLGSAATVVLGNHDLYLLARLAGHTPGKERDTLQRVVDAPDARAVREWLRRRPLCARVADHLVVHAGLLPGWTLAEAERRARAVEATLQGPRWAEFVLSLRRGDSPEHQTVAAMTRLRMLHRDGRPEWRFNGPPEDAPLELVPWYTQSQVLQRHQIRLLFGHWAALGLRWLPGAVALDSGCVWGRELTAVRLDDGAVFREPLRDLVAA